MPDEFDCPIRKAGFCSDIIRNTEQVKNLTIWQENQDKTSARIEAAMGQMSAALTTLSTSLATHVAFHLGSEKAVTASQLGRRWSVQMAIMVSNIIVGLLAIGITAAVAKLVH